MENKSKITVMLTEWHTIFYLYKFEKLVEFFLAPLKIGGLIKQKHWSGINTAKENNSWSLMLI